MPDLPQEKTNLNFYVGILQKYEFMDDGHKSMLGLWIPVWLEPDLFGQSHILERIMVDRLHHGCVTQWSKALKQPIFKRKKCSQTLV
jgi:hypothetical protein